MGTFSSFAKVNGHPNCKPQELTLKDVQDSNGRVQTVYGRYQPLGTKACAFLKTDCVPFYI